MSAVLTCRVTQLLYVEAPHLNFAHVVGDLHTALAAPNLFPPILTWDCDDIALLDFNAGRVVVGFSEDLPGEHAACLTVAAGSLPTLDAPMLTEADQELLCQAVAERLERRYPCDARLDRSLDQDLTPDLIDHLVESLVQDNNDAPVLDTSGEIVDPPLPSSDEVDVDRLMSRLSQELVTRAPSVITRAIASATAIAPSAKMQSSGQTKPSLSERHFWPMPLFVRTKTHFASGTSVAASRQRGASGELKAVRDALYADDHATDSNTRRVGIRIATHTRRALEVLVSLPASLANSATDLKRKQNIGDRVRH